MAFKKSTKATESEKMLTAEVSSKEISATDSNTANSAAIEALIKTSIEQSTTELEKFIQQIKTEILNDNNKFLTRLLAKVASLEKTVSGSAQPLNETSGFKLAEGSDIRINTTDNSNELQVTGMHLLSGKSISADKINTELAKAESNIKLIKNKLELVALKVNSLNAYMASHNFKKDKPTLEELDTFAIRCLSAFGAYIKRELIPAGTCIKNTFDNHIWIFNKFTAYGLTSYKWEDYGLNLISIADNFGTHGIVAGSNDKFRGYVDLNGVISINGLEEELATIVATIRILENNLQLYKSDLAKQLNDFETRLTVLERR